MRGMPGHAASGSLLRAGALVLILPTLAHACAVCVGSSPEDAGYFWGVLFLMFMPFAVGGLIGGWLLYHFRRAQGGLLSSAAPAIVGGPSTRPASIAPASAIRHDGSPSLQA